MGLKKIISLEDHTGLTLLSCQTSLITASGETQKYRILDLRVYILFIFFPPTICRAMLSLLILRLACLTSQIILNNPTRSHSSLLNTVLRHRPLKGRDVEKQRPANDRHFYSHQTHNPSELMTSLCVGADSHRSHVNLQLWHM